MLRDLPSLFQDTLQYLLPFLSVQEVSFSNLRCDHMHSELERWLQTLQPLPEDVKSEEDMIMFDMEISFVAWDGNSRNRVSSRMKGEIQRHNGVSRLV